MSITACPIDHSCQRNFARYAGLRWVNVTDLGSVSSVSYVIADHYIFAIFGAVALHERPGSLRSGLDAVLHMSRIEFEFRSTQINLDRLN